jgi:DnaJ-class molecular chaperone
MQVEKTDQNLYEILGVSRYASRETIQEAYREIAKLYHPDSNHYSEIIQDPVRKEHLDFFQHATEAYQVLSSVEKRQAYDQRLGKELEDWDSTAASAVVSQTRFAERAGRGSQSPMLTKQARWFKKNTSMHEIIQRHQNRGQRRVMRFALAAPFLFVVLVCVVMTFIF